MDKKTIGLVIVCVVLLVFWNQIAEFVGLIKPVPQTQPQEITETAPVQTQAQQSPTAQQPVAQEPTIVDSAYLPITDSLGPEELMLVTTPLYSLGFTNNGGGICSILLNEYTYHDGGNVIMAQASDKIVPDFEAANGAFKGVHRQFVTYQTGFGLSSGDSPREIIYVYDNGKGGRIIKTYTINPDAYDIGFDITIEGIETFGFEYSYDIVWDISIPPTETNIEDDYEYYYAVAMMDEETIEYDDFEIGIMNESQIGPTAWAGMRTKYFATVVIPRSRPTEGFNAKGIKRSVLIDGDNIDTKSFSSSLKMQLPTRGTQSDSFTLFAGPIDYQMLKGYNVGLEKLTSLGWWIIKPFSIGIIWLLPKIYNVIPNYGIVVLIFALLIKIITFPLSRKQTAAMAKMKDLQPKMKVIQEKYKNDSARLNKEMMKLYKVSGANPISGCLPMLPQMPLFFALFTVFKTTIEFRGASFMFWITDLSVPDPFYVLPIIMTVSMFFQQKLTMTDHKNKMMVYMMPLLFGWLFMNFPAGLVLYWTGFNILSFAETMYVRNKMDKNPEVKEVK